MRLRIRTLGGLSVHANSGEPIHAATALRRPAAVLVVVAAAGDRGITRDKLLGILWPDSNAERARHSLTQAIYNARRVTGVDDLFLTDGAVRLNAERVTSDIEEFESAIAAGDFERAVAMYDGPFLDGFYVSDSAEFEQWASAQRVRLEAAMASALEQLAMRAANAGDPRRALEWRRRLAALRPLDSTAALSLVAALAQQGDRAGALQHAEAHAALLKEQLELDVDSAFAATLAALRESPAAAPAPADVSSRLATPELGDSPRLTDGPVGTKRLFRARPTRRWLLAGAAVGLLALFVRRDAASRTADRGADSAQPSLWVAPFDVSGASPSVDYLGRGVAQLLSGRLDNVADRRSFDAGVVAAAWRESGFDTLHAVARDSVVRLAADRGAHRVIIGSVVGDRDRAVLSASLISAADDSVLATATVEGSADSVSVLSSRLAAKLLYAEAHEELAISWDTPLPALAAFLEGRRFYHQSAYTAAVRSFQTAIRIDSTFAPAALQLARVADRLGDLETEGPAVMRAWQHREMLDDASRTLLLALAGPRYPAPSPRNESLDAWAHVVRIWPQRPGSWFELAVRLTHDGRRLGVEGSSEQALAALNRALVIDPAYMPARDLLAHLALRPSAQGDHSLAGFHADTASALAPFLRWRAAVAHGDSEAQAALRADMRSLSAENLRAIALASQFDAIGLDDGKRAVDLLASRAVTADERVDAVLAAHSLALNTGRTTEAIAQTTRLRDLRPDSHAYLRLRVLDALYGGGDPAAASGAAAQLAAPVDSLFRSFPMLRSRVASDACVLAQWRLAHHDTTEIRAIATLLHARDVARIDQPVTATPSICGDLVDAELAVVSKRKDARVLVDRLDSLMFTSAVSGNISQYANLAISRMYVTLGDTRRALTAIRKRDYMCGWPAYLGTVWREEAQLARSVGDSKRVLATSDRISALRAASVPQTLPIPDQR